MRVMLPRLKQALSQQQKAHATDDSQIPAAVIIAIYYKEEEHHILFTKRTERVKEHKGEISFPGGAYEEPDGTLLNTALRECTEEIGLAPEAVELLGELDDSPTISSNYIISPFVAAIPWPYPFKLDPIETEEIIEAPISALLDENCRHEETRVLGGQLVTTYFYHYQGEIIWGATARMLKELLEIISQVMESTEE